MQVMKRAVVLDFMLYYYKIWDAVSFWRGLFEGCQAKVTHLKSLI